MRGTASAVKSVKEYQFSLCERSEIRDFVEEHHYSHNINGVISDYCFKLEFNNKLIGAMIFGRFGMANVWKKYGDSQSEVLELRRLVLVDDTKRNAESYFIGRALRWLKLNTQVKTIVSYADNTFGHEGVIYQATNFKRIGVVKPQRVIKYNNKSYHDKAIRTKYKGELKPFAKRLVKALEDGTAVYEESKTKNIYIYKLK